MATGGETASVPRIGGHQDHLVCRSCGCTSACAVVARPRVEPGDAAGFVVDEAEVVFWGLCPECQRRGPVSEVELPGA
jgi:Fe2+ or Zn2+ uptake regulation protein